MVLAGVVSVAAAIAAFFVGVLVVFVAAIVFTVAIAAALVITVGLLVVVLVVSAVIAVGPILAFLGAMVFLASAVLAVAHRRPSARSASSARPASSGLGRMRRPRVGPRRPRAETPRPRRPLIPAGIVGVRRVDAVLGHGLLLRSRAHRDPLEREGASEVELEHV